MSHFYMGVDLGGTVTKAGIYTADGEEIGVVEQTAPLLSAQSGFCERDMAALWDATCQAIRQALAESGVAAADIRGVSFSAHGKGLYLVDKQGRPVRNGIVSSDSRAQPLVTQWKQEGRDSEAWCRSLQQLWPSHPPALLAWLKQHEPQSYDRAGYILMVHDYIRFCLTGELACEETNISGSNLFNQREGAFDPALFHTFGIDEMADKTPTVIGSADLAGYVTPEAAARCGLKAGTPVFGGFFDVVGAALTSGVHDNTCLSAVAGTWSIATRVFDRIEASDYPYVWGKYCIPGTYFVHEGSPTSASNLAWFVQQFFPDLPGSYSQLNRWAENGYGKDINIQFFPWLYGSNFHDSLHGGFLGLSGHHSREDMVYAIYQGIVFSHLLHQDRVQALGSGSGTIRFTGGPTHSAIWMQMFCDASNLPIEIVDVQQSGCRAAAICAAVGAGEYADFQHAMKHCQPPTLRLEPDHAKHRMLRKRFEHFKRIAGALSEVAPVG